MAKPCPSCGEELTDGVKFCEACGAKVESGEVEPTKLAGDASPSRKGRVGAPGDTEEESAAEANTRKRGKRFLLIALVGFAVLGAGFGLGYLVADDSSQVSALQTELAGTQDELDGSEVDNESLSDELEKVSDAKGSLADKLKAERSISGSLPTPDKNIDVSANADYVMGEPGIVGSTVMRPTGIERVGPAGGGSRYQLKVDVKNDGKKPINPFCGGEEATILDSTGREYSGESTLDFDSPNCGDDIQPGLTKSGYLMEFTLPNGAKPTLIELVFESYSGEDPVTWAVK